MDTIRSYVENMFAPLPKTEQLMALQAEMLGNMEERYQELKSQGATENEAIGQVISEFGNLDELLAELELAPSEQDDYAANQANGPLLPIAEAEAYVGLYSESNLLVACGVAIIIFGASLLIFFTCLADSGWLFANAARGEEYGIYLGLTLLLLCVAVGVVLFIYSGYKMQAFKHIESGCFSLTEADWQLIREHLAIAEQESRLYVIIGVCLCVLSPLAILIGHILHPDGSTYGVCVLLLMIALAVWLFIRSSRETEPYMQLLHEEESGYQHNSKEKPADKLIGLVGGLVWPLAVIIYLLMGFIANLWHPGWLIFPITGILFSAFSGVVGYFNGGKEK